MSWTTRGYGPGHGATVAQGEETEAKTKEEADIPAGQEPMDSAFGDSDAVCYENRDEYLMW